MTNPFGVAKWYEAGWRPPTPHQVLGLLMAVAIGIPIIGLAEHNSVLAKLCELFALVCGGTGIVSAKNHLSPQILSKLEAVDARALNEISERTEGAKRP